MYCWRNFFYRQIVGSWHLTGTEHMLLKATVMVRFFCGALYAKALYSYARNHYNGLLLLLLLLLKIVQIVQ